MRKYLLALFLFGFCLQCVVLLDSYVRADRFLPENDLYIGTSEKSTSSISEKDFNDIIVFISSVYNPIVEGLGKKLDIKGDWSDGTVNAYASQSGNTLMVRLFGGLARSDGMTLDSFAIVICHELGHHLGGAPKKNVWSWASAEGQSDFYATSVCLRNVYASFVARSHSLTTTVAQDLCSAAHEDPALCIRSANAGLAVGQLFQQLGHESTAVALETPDPTVVAKTNAAGYPGSQCRVDTYFQGALCNDSSCVRPRCWFKPIEFIIE